MRMHLGKLLVDPNGPDVLRLLFRNPWRPVAA